MNYVLSVCYLLIILACSFKSSSFTNEINLADPTIFLHNGTYYLYGTVEGSADEGFLVYVSEDMKNWKSPKDVENGFALHKKDNYGDKGFWAPQVFFHDGKFYMAYTANENIAIAVSDSPVGPFRQKIKEPLNASVKQIDPFVFIDNDKKYLFHVRLAEGNRIFVAELSDDFMSVKAGTLKECINADTKWENNADASWPVTEGPSVFKWNDLYYLVYSANDFRSIDYGVGYAVSDNPEGPWKKSKRNPVLHRKDLGINGTGHGDFVQDKKGDLVYVFHTHQSNNVVAPRKTALIKARLNNDQLEMDFSSYFLPELVKE